MTRILERLLILGSGLGLALTTSIGCLEQPVLDGGTSQETNGNGESETTGETPGESESETTGASDDETTGEDDETTGEGDETAGDGDGDEPQPCEWTNFPVQYGVGDLGQSCGALHDDATQEDIDLVLACLEEAYDAEAAAFGTLSWSDPVSNFYKVSWYVRPPGEGGPRRFETRWFQAIAEEGPYPPPNMNV